MECWTLAREPLRRQEPGGFTRGKVTSCFGERPSYESKLGAGDGQDLGHARKFRAFGWAECWQARTPQLKDLPYRHGPRYTILLFPCADVIPLKLRCVDNCCSSLIECDVFRSVVENASVMGRQL